MGRNQHKKRPRQLHLGYAHATGSAPDELDRAVRLAEDAAFDFVLLDGRRDTGTGLEPFTAAAHAAVRSTRIGLLATGDPLRHEPFNLARLVASLDHISGGRAGWLVTEEHPGGERAGPLPRADAVERTREFVGLVRALWDSWDDDAFVRDKGSGAFVDADRIRAVDHVGAHFQVRGPLNLARPPQGHPVLAHAADELAAAVPDAELVLPGGATDRGEHAAVLPDLIPVLGEDVAEVRDLHEQLHATPGGERALASGAVLIGDPDTVAGRIAESFSAGQVDGYLLHAPPQPGQLRRFTELVVPLLRRRGVFRHDYADRSLRSHLNLTRPARRDPSRRPAPPRTGAAS
ncbi:MULTISPECIES: LLM class flavin-dependent oxidoreductase [unclassified Saccharopolyspora]|uniref:LLM class flavin-dependent oxidoreductase n=1 Tax=unclassified Saccharopolyspora TaxID=2646250 RepID=UPI001CD4199C|nr:MULTISPECIES: LLM class flavin-dependent oxidoreductase [unclassified Saccharopolyspora]MCA1226572.1 LLM class flavin-dependent oxidoreductase [Saccharopolyspora sp. 6M]MCA1281995.1 LLM class flavin-dependent oxidoreductase [Saccharopolyspora sp. 7B]